MEQAFEIYPVGESMPARAGLETGFEQSGNTIAKKILIERSYHELSCCLSSSAESGKEEGETRLSGGVCCCSSRTDQVGLCGSAAKLRGPAHLDEFQDFTSSTK